MKVLVVYDTEYGNTEKIARAIGGAIEGDVNVVRVTEADLSALESVDLFIVGSPTQRAAQTLPVKAFLDRIPGGALNNIDVAAFDTRYSTKSGGIGTRLIAKMAAGFGYAAPRIADTLKEKGGNLVVPPEAFIVNGTKGPLKEGEFERAAAWAARITNELEKKGEG